MHTSYFSGSSQLVAALGRVTRQVHKWVATIALGTCSMSVYIIHVNCYDTRLQWPMPIVGHKSLRNLGALPLRSDGGPSLSS